MLEPITPVEACRRPGSARRWLYLALLMFGAHTAYGEVVTTRAPAALRVGQVTLYRCQSAAPWCGRIPRPLDPSGAVPGVVSVYFEYYPHFGKAAASGTLVATEGGPGFPATESRDEYLALFAPLRATHDVLIMDNRGTGASGAVDCAALQNAPSLTESDIGACGRSLGSAASLYSTALASDDLAALLDELAIKRVGLYGDSYGTYFAQVFALRHPAKLYSLVLDGAYPLDGPDYAWYPHYAPAMREKFNLACARSVACQAIPGSSMEHVAPTLELLRAAPAAAEAPDGTGRMLHFTAGATELAIVMFGGSPAYASVRELDAAARAFRTGDRAPLLRLMAETLGSVDSRDPTHSPAKFSAGLAAAVFCQDPPQIFDMRLEAVARVASRERLIAQRKSSAPDTYAPFTIDEYRGMPLDYAFIDECVQWPAKSAPPLGSGDVRYPQTPVLVVSGELDNMTSVADGAAAAARFPRAHHVVIANSFHVNALPHARSECAAMLVRRFMENLTIGDESCAAAVPAVHLVARFARRAQELPPARGLPGNRASPDELRVVNAALMTVADVTVRAAENGAGSSVGLRGGTFTATTVNGGYRLILREVRWTQDLSVSGRIDSPDENGLAHAHVEVQAPAGAGTLEITWPQGTAEEDASVRGSLGGRRVVAQAPAP